MAGGISKVVYTWYRRDIEERVYCKKKNKNNVALSMVVG